MADEFPWMTKNAQLQKDKIEGVLTNFTQDGRYSNPMKIHFDFIGGI